MDTQQRVSRIISRSKYIISCKTIIKKMDFIILFILKISSLPFVSRIEHIYILLSKYYFYKKIFIIHRKYFEFLFNTLNFYSIFRFIQLDI